MSVIIRLQNLPWSANALDIRNFFRGLSIPEGGVHIVGGELGDAFIAFSTDEDARQGMMMDGGKIKEIQVKLLLSSRSEMHKVIEAARQSVPILTLTAPAPAPVPTPATIVPTIPTVPSAPIISPFTTALGNNTLASFGIPGIGNPQEIPQPAVIEPPAPMISPPVITTPEDDDDRSESRRNKERDRRRSRSHSRSRDRDRKDRKRDRRERSRSRDRRRERRERSRSRERRDRKRNVKERSRSRERSSPRHSRDRRIDKGPINQEKSFDRQQDSPVVIPPFGNMVKPQQMMGKPTMGNNMMNGSAAMPPQDIPNRFNDPTIVDAYSKLHELGRKRNPNAFQGDREREREPQNGNGNRFPGRGGHNNYRRDGRDGRSRFELEREPDCCVAIRNAPNHTSYGDVRRFFPCLIDKQGIKMINDNMGRRTGNIFVRFCDPRSKQLALQRRINELKGAEVNVEPLDDEAFDVAVDSFLPYRDDNDEEDASLVIADETPLPAYTVLKVTDLPNFVKEHDIMKTFSDFSLLSIMLHDCRISRSKIAFIQFAKAEDVRLAMERKERIVFGRRHPTLTPISDEDYEKEKASLQPDKIPDPRMMPDERANEAALMMEQHAPLEPLPPAAPRDPRQRRQPDGPPQHQSQPFFPGQFVQGQFGGPAPAPAPFVGQFGGYPGPSGALDPRTAAANWANRPGFPNQVQNNVINVEDEPLDCVLMKGLPRDATDRTIVNFLSDTGAVPARIHLMLDGSGLPSGDCFCEFRSPSEARMAVGKHGANLDGCRVTVDLVTRSVVEEALEGPKVLEPRDGLLGNAPLLLGSGPQFYDGPAPAPRGGYQPRGGGYRGRGGYERGGGFERGFERGGGGGFDRDRDRGGSGGGYMGGFESRGGGGYRGRGSFHERGRGFERGRGRGGGGYGRGGRGGFDNARERDGDDQDPALEDFGAPGCVVSMENVPFRASVEEILQFFSDFELTQDDIIRRYNERGQPTGDARVAFRTPFDAQRAIKTRHMDNIHDRRISLTIL